MKFYTLRHIPSGKYCGFYSESNDNGEYCVSESFTLEPKFSRNLWAVCERRTAEKVIENGSQEWYNAGYETPTYFCESSELEVVEFELP